MQVYGFRLGKTLQLTKPFTLEELQVQFSCQLNERSPVLAQMFVHLQAPRIGRSWQISQESEVPTPLISYKEQPQEACDYIITINADLRALIQGRGWPLVHLINILENCENGGILC